MKQRGREQYTLGKKLEKPQNRKLQMIVGCAVKALKEQTSVLRVGSSSDFSRWFLFKLTH